MKENREIRKNGGLNQFFVSNKSFKLQKRLYPALVPIMLTAVGRDREFIEREFIEIFLEDEDLAGFWHFQINRAQMYVQIRLNYSEGLYHRYRCFHCNKHSKAPKICSRCHMAFYCNQECQRNDHGNHSRFCREMAQAQESHPSVIVARG